MTCYLEDTKPAQLLHGEDSACDKQGEIINLNLTLLSLRQ